MTWQRRVTRRLATPRTASASATERAVIVVAALRGWRHRLCYSIHRWCWQFLTPDFPLEGVALSMTAALPANATCFDTGEAGGT